MIRNHTAPMSAVNSSRLQASEGAQEAARRHRHSDSRGETSGSRDLTPRSRFGEPQDESTQKSSGGGNSRQRRSRTRERSEKDKKTMLSKALQKANTAVVLDNAQNFEGALDAYGDACKLLLQVMDRSSGVEDKRKLEAIRVTYTNRIEELRQLEAAQPDPSDGKSLPARPMSDDSLAMSPVTAAVSPIDASLRDSAVIETATTTRVVDVPKLSHPKQDRDSFFSGTVQAFEASSQQDFDRRKPSIPKIEPLPEEEPSSGAQSDRRKPSIPKVEAFSEGERSLGAPFERRTSLAKAAIDPQEEEPSPAEDKKAAGESPLRTQTLHLPTPDDSSYMPAPLSPRRPLSPKREPEAEPAREKKDETSRQQEGEASPERQNSNASVSWLDTIDESGSSRASSVHSVSSQQGLRRKHLRGASDSTNPDFDAAFDAAVEAAYNEGFEPDLEGRQERVKGASKHGPKASLVVPSSDIKEILSPTNAYHPSSRPLELTSEDEEEERLLDDITQDYAQSFNFDVSSKSALPRQSDSSGYSRSTWQSSQPSERTTAGTSLSTVNEDTLPTRFAPKQGVVASSINTVLAENLPPSAPPPQTALPRPPSMSQNRLSGVRSRRLSGQNSKQLKIETSSATKPEARKRASTFHHSPSTFQEEEPMPFEKDAKFGDKLEPTDSNTQHEQMLKSPPSLDLRSAVSDTSRPLTATTMTTEQGKSLDEEPGELRTHRPNLFRKNKSSVSLREHKVLLSPTDDSGPSAVTPLSSTFMPFGGKKTNDHPMTSQRANFPSFGGITTEGQASGGIYLFDTSLSSAQLPSSPRSPGFGNQPTGLEPCPESYLLRPFWLMRALSSTLTHPKGGFLTTRLFVPREVWQTRGVKLKAVEDKIANCDLLTAALGRLAGVDTYDADAVMEELQSFEEVMERVQTALAKKLGSDVGVGGLAGLFKEAASGSGATSGASNAPGAEVTAGAEKTKSKESKGYLNSWRKLRSKSSGTPLGSAHVHKTAEKELPSMASVPMTRFVPVERRGQKKEVKNLVFDGPNREYMGSLARLVEGVQVLGKVHSFSPASSRSTIRPKKFACFLKHNRGNNCVLLPTNVPVSPPLGMRACIGGCT